MDTSTETGVHTSPQKQSVNSFHRKHQSWNSRALQKYTIETICAVCLHCVILRLIKLFHWETGKMASWTTHLLCKRKDLDPDPQHRCQCWVWCSWNLNLQRQIPQCSSLIHPRIHWLLQTHENMHPHAHCTVAQTHAHYTPKAKGAIKTISFLIVWCT